MLLQRHFVILHLLVEFAFAVNLTRILKFIIMADFDSIMAILLLVLNALLFMVEIVYYVVKTAKELS